MNQSRGIFQGDVGAESFISLPRGQTCAEAEPSLFVLVFPGQPVSPSVRYLHCTCRGMSLITHCVVDLFPISGSIGRICVQAFA
jgi:hypothetical protein